MSRSVAHLKVAALTLGTLLAGACATSSDALKRLPAAQEPASAIQHLIVIIQENHSFDSYFGRYCKAAPRSEPSCTSGPACCEAGPDKDPGTGSSPYLLDDNENATYDPNHSQACELEEMNGGRMDHFVNGTWCSNPKNFAYANGTSLPLYWKLASRSALADRYFQPIAGASSSNDMYLARAQYVFTDNQVEPLSAGSQCGDVNPNRKFYTDPTIGDLLISKSVSWAFYSEGYRATVQARAKGTCPTGNNACPNDAHKYPCIYDPSDNPFEYYVTLADNPTHMRDYADLFADLKHGTLPSVNYVKSFGYRSEHPGGGTTLSEGQKFIKEILDGVAASPFAASTLILLVPDEGGGFFDHVTPPAGPTVDAQPYGTRIPLLAIGPFARANTVSHVLMEHSSIVKFIEWNWLGQTGQLQGRDKTVNNIGSLLDPAKTGIPVPEH